MITTKPISITNTRNNSVELKEMSTQISKRSDMWKLLVLEVDPLKD